MVCYCLAVGRFVANTNTLFICKNERISFRAEALISVRVCLIYPLNGEIKKDNLIKIYMHSKTVLYGTIRFNYMIPVPASELEKVSVNDEGDFKYKILMQSEYFFVNTNRDKIEKTAVRLHKMRTTYNPEQNKNKLMEITLDFTSLEKMCDEFSKKD